MGNVFHLFPAYFPKMPSSFNLNSNSQKAKEKPRKEPFPPPPLFGSLAFTPFASNSKLGVGWASSGSSIWCRRSVTALLLMAKRVYEVWKGGNVRFFLVFLFFICWFFGCWFDCVVLALKDWFFMDLRDCFADLWYLIVGGFWSWFGLWVWLFEDLWISFVYLCVQLDAAHEKLGFLLLRMLCGLLK